MSEPLTVDVLTDMLMLYGQQPTKLYVKRETVRRLRAMLKPYEGVAVLGKRVRWRRGRWQVISRT